MTVGRLNEKNSESKLEQSGKRKKRRNNCQEYFFKNEGITIKKRKVNYYYRNHFDCI